MASLCPQRDESHQFWPQPAQEGMPLKRGMNFYLEDRNLPIG
jgi:hypothetical protein